jgi:hypothetical protein
MGTLPTPHDPKLDHGPSHLTAGQIYLAGAQPRIVLAWGVTRGWSLSLLARKEGIGRCQVGAALVAGPAGRITGLFAVQAPWSSAAMRRGKGGHASSM